MSENKWLWISDVENAYRKAIRLSAIPGKEFQKVEVGHVFDEDKSVKWNREEVIRVNNEYKEEEDRLREIRNQSIDDARYKIYKYIAQETNLSIAQASVFWNYVYDKFNDFGNLFEELDGAIEFYNDLIKTGKGENKE